jgi:hypothetical protein
MSKIEEALAKASELRECSFEDKSEQRDVFIKKRDKNNWLYVSIIPALAVILVIPVMMTFVLFINTNIASQHPTHVVTKKAETDSQKIAQYNKAITDNQNLSHTINTIQTGSFIAIERAQKQFDSLAQILNKSELDYLRIEKVDKYYSVRVGNFQDYAIAKKFLRTNKHHLSSAVILNAYIKDERIIRLHKDSISADC